MSDQDNLPTQRDLAQAQSTLPPPRGDTQKGDKYIDQLVALLNKDKVRVFQTDLARFDPSLFQDHYRIDLKDYQIEISHSKNPDSAKDSFVMVFTNLNRLQPECNDKVVLAYIHLGKDQYERFKQAAQLQIDRIKRLEEEKRFYQAIKPVDSLLEQVENDDTKVTDALIPKTSVNP